eukprot:jgi/Chlat1/9121/Chrsp97S08424
MQYYTRQQLQGAQKYGGPCRIGNWNEDRVQQEASLKAFLERASSGQLSLQARASREARALAPVARCAASDDGVVRLGDVVSLRSCFNNNANIGPVLAVDAEGRDAGQEGCAAVTATTLHMQPCARNTFILVRYVPPRSASLEKVWEGDCIRYGQKVRLAANPLADPSRSSLTDLRHPLFLRSQPVSTSRFAKHSHRQEVWTSYARDYAAAWEVAHPRPEARAVMEGRVVKYGEPVILRHAATREDLCCDGMKCYNDFGTELEICAHTVTRKGMVHALESASEGKPKAMLDKAEQCENFWCFEGADVIGVHEYEYLEPEERAALLPMLCAQVTSTATLERLERAFEMEDKKCHDAVGLTGLRKALELGGVKMSEKDTERLLRCYDTDESQHVDYRALLNDLWQLVSAATAVH